ncbi:hypothetical protein [Rhodoferax sp. PAMC 29310]|uniref:hypothetical protein n=1 Tax=Rhodoferax sp. PAMC 29310 TaxID=2822760 RepID=UPI001B33276F|nr:hypothetical protein [Rhodoferax sp. PAMC 29310]
MIKSVSLALGTVLAISAMFSQVAAAATPAASECSAKAVSKAGKPLAGAAKNAFMKKCEADSGGAAAPSGCADKAISKAGKPLAGAAKTGFLKKCEADVLAGK